MPEPGARAIARAVSTILDESAPTPLQLIALGPAAAMPLGLRLVPENLKAADGRILIYMQGYEQWVETGGTFGRFERCCPILVPFRCVTCR
ncbi:hypothetical protein [Burkholderia ubonensis]|uniref:hypothetical protein n=1 Tax=Burkholderia ubonensis TaxID=101571 RepID=UPI00076D3CDA|nr:hypothetical protein [Burkholderia ubonensis]KVD28197.1 hypothetical protein WI83_23615 [Burkholderia ubonensis]